MGAPSQGLKKPYAFEKKNDSLLKFKAF